MSGSPLSRPRGTAAWTKLLRLIPGYDPLRDQGDCTFDDEAAWDVVRFFHEELTHVKGELALQPFYLQAWQMAIVCNLYGWKRPDGRRRYRECGLWIGRKNGKTPLAGGLCLYALAADGERGAEVISAASDRDQASLIFHHADGMVVQSPRLSRELKVNRGVGQRTISYRAAMSVYQVIDAVPEGAHGLNIHFCAIDELHAQRGRDLVDTLQTGFGARRQPMMLYTTTADFLRESICNELYDYCCRVRDGEIDDDSLLPVIYEASKDDDWTDQKVWEKANPNLGVSLSLDYLKRECRKAQRNVAYEATFKRLHLNIQTETETLFISETAWKACSNAEGQPTDPVEWREWAMEHCAGKPCYAGLDLGYTRDLTALTLLFPPHDKDPYWYTLPFYWVPNDTMQQRTKNDHVPYYQWVQDDYIWLTDGNVTDYDFVRSDIVSKIAPRFLIKEIAYDRFKAMQIIQQLENEGIEMVEYAMSAVALNPPMQEVERLVGSKKLLHGGNPVLIWNALNTAVRHDSNANMRPDKGKSRDRIDGFVALLMALGRVIVAKEKKHSVYRKRGLRSL